MTLEKSLQALEERQEHKIVPGLDRISRHLSLLGYPHKDFRSIHVAGTNGKGSTCAILESALRAAGYKTGFYLSPQLESPRERVRVSGEWISEEDFKRLLEKILRLDPEQELTYFEILTSLAFQYFSEEKIDVAIVETGLGGRLDATNVIEKPLASVITSIDFDHTNWLGNTLQEIAREKAGIIKKDCAVFCPRLPEAALSSIQEKAESLGAPLNIVETSWAVKKIDWGKNSQILETPWGEEAILTLLGSSQGRNAALAWAVLSYLNQNQDLKISHADVQRGLALVSWPGRFEVLSAPDGKTAILDGAHNPEAMRNFSNTWAQSPWAKTEALWVIGMMRDKDIYSSLKSLPQEARSIIAVSPLHPRATRSADLAKIAREVFPLARVWEANNLEQSLDICQNQGWETLVVCGSLYLVDWARKSLAKRGFKNGEK